MLPPKFYLLVLSSLLLCATLGTALRLEYTISDYNTLQPIENVNITVVNDSVSISNLTDIYGKAELYTSTVQYSIVYITRSGYDSTQVYRDYVNDTQEYYSMNPSSTAGIVRLAVNDLTFSDHNFCIFFTDNGRMDKCYDSNTTYFVLHTNINYTIIPMVTKTDLLSSPENIGNNIYLFSGSAIGLLFIVFIFSVLISFAIVIYNKIKR